MVATHILVPVHKVEDTNKTVNTDNQDLQTANHCFCYCYHVMFMGRSSGCCLVASHILHPTCEGSPLQDGQNRQF